MTHSKTFCPLPWIHLATRPNGDVRLCCTANASGAGMIDEKSVGLVKDNDQPFNFAKDSLDTVWNSNAMKTIRLQMLNNEIPRSCTKCFEEESNGIVSKRQWETLVWKERLDLDSIVDKTTATGELPVEIPYFDLRLGNVCQLKCIMCSPHDSSSWINDWKLQYPKYKTIELKQDQGWDKQYNYTWYSNTSFLESVKGQVKNLKELYFAGGEPLIIPEHYKILEFMVASGDAKNCILRYNSNGLELPDRLFDLWKHFKLVKFNFSIDAYKNKNDYIRYPSKWRDVVSNLHKLDQTGDNVIINMACAVQLLNVLYLDELAEWKISQRFKKINLVPFGGGLIGLHLVYLPSYLNIKVLPRSLKELAKNRIETFLNTYRDTEFVNSPSGKQRWEGIVKYMMSEDWSSKLPSTIEYLTVSDQTRNTDFRNTFRDLMHL